MRRLKQSEFKVVVEVLMESENTPKVRYKVSAYGHTLRIPVS